MAKSRYVFRSPQLTIGAGDDQVDVHPFITNMTLTSNAQVTTVEEMGSDGPCHIPTGRSSGDTLEVTINQDFSQPASLALFNMVNTTQPITVTSETGAVAAGNPSWTGTGVISNYTALSGSPGENSPNSLSIMIDGKLELKTS